ncbi:DEP domain-containing protein 1A [Callorhinchus milii]|uniref:DEP domain-containing protein 1A n=1 Tax=Callorhinchus milii TaxID=7868 RepID=UPI001C3FF40A|nr:DEP domain-containing protein 1A [Callorhinchus milii]
MDARVTAPGPYRATKLWNEMTKLFRAGMPLRKHRLHFKRYGSCFTASEAVDWLHELLRSNSNFGPDVTRQQTLQLLRKFLKNHVIEDIKGRWGSENVEDNSQLYRFPTTSPLKIIPSHPPFYRKNATQTYPKDKDGFLKFSRRTPKKYESPQVCEEESCKEMSDLTPEGQLLYIREVTQSDREEAWREIAIIHLQKILGPASLEEVLDFSQVLPQHITYNVQNVSKHGVVILQDKSDDLPHWVLSAMKCLASWPRNNDSCQPTYPGFERDVFKTVADYFLTLPEPLLTLQYYELFVNILVLCGYIMVSKRPQGKRKNLDEPCCPQPAKSQHLNNHTNFFKSTECLLLSLVRKDLSEETRRLLEPAEEEEEEEMECSPKQRVTQNHRNLQKGCARHLNQHAVGCRKTRVSKQLLGGSCQNLTHLKDYHSELSTVQSRYSSVSHIAGLSHDCSSGERVADPAGCERMDVSGPGDDQPHHQNVHLLTSSRLRAESMTDLRSEGDGSPMTISRCNSAWILTEHNHEPCRACPDSGLFNGQLTKANTQKADVDGQRYPGLQSQRLQRYSKVNSSGLNKAANSKLTSATGSFSSINAPVARNSMKPFCSSEIGLRRPSAFCLATSAHNKCFASEGTNASQENKSAVGGSENRAHATAYLSTGVGSFNGTSLLQPHLEKVAIEALQLCCLFLPPHYRRKLQLLLRMMARISQNVDMPPLHSTVGTRTLMIQTFSRCILRCEREVDLDELLATRLVSFLLDHHQDILVVPLYLSNAVRDHISHLQKAQIKYPCTSDIGSGPTYTFCQQISVKEFEEQKVSASQVAISELLENILKDQRLPVKDKRKKLKQFQKEYPDIYQQRFPVTDSEAAIFQGKPKIKPAMLLTMKRPLQSLQNLRS